MAFLVRLVSEFDLLVGNMLFPLTFLLKTGHTIRSLLLDAAHHCRTLNGRFMLSSKRWSEVLSISSSFVSPTTQIQHLGFPHPIFFFLNWYDCLSLTALQFRLRDSHYKTDHSHDMDTTISKMPMTGQQRNSITKETLGEKLNSLFVNK